MLSARGRYRYFAPPPRLLMLCLAAACHFSQSNSSASLKGKLLAPQLPELLRAWLPSSLPWPIAGPVSAGPTQRMVPKAMALLTAR
eukprot:COSAG01_NODE_5477_length_4236_cov_2.696157_6_plen_86_part_00